MSSITPAHVPELPPLLTIHDVRRVLSCSRDVAYEVMHACGVVKLGRSLRVRPQDLNAYIERQRVAMETA